MKTQGWFRQVLARFEGKPYVEVAFVPDGDDATPAIQAAIDYAIALTDQDNVRMEGNTFRPGKHQGIKLDG